MESFNIPLAKRKRDATSRFANATTPSRSGISLTYYTGVTVQIMHVQ